MGAQGFLSIYFSSCAAKSVRPPSLLSVSTKNSDFKIIPFATNCPLKTGRLLLASNKSPQFSFGKPYSDTGNLLLKVDFQQKQITAIPTPLKMTHSAMLMPGKKERCVIVEKDDSNACIVDLENNICESTFSSKEGWNFNGHCIFSPDQKFFYDAEYNQKNKEAGAIVIRNAETMEIIGELDSGGIQPHDMKFFAGGSRLAVAHYGKLAVEVPKNLLSTVTVLEMPSGKILETISSPGENQELCHIAVTEDGKYLVSVQDFLSAAPPGANDKNATVAVGKQNFRIAPIMIGKFGESHEVLMPKKFQDNFLFNFSVALDTTRNVAAVAHFFGELVTFWDLNTQKFIKGKKLPESTSGVAITADFKTFIASNYKKLYFFDSENFEQMGSFDFGFNISAPHSLYLPSRVS